MTIANEIHLPRKEAIDFVYKKYAPLIYGLICTHFSNRLTCHVVFQDAFVRALSTYTSYDPDKSRLFTWMYWIAFDEIQKAKEKEDGRH